VGRAKTHLAAFYHDIRACQKYADACARIAGRTADANTRDACAYNAAGCGSKNI
jgi:hypothetical protein